MCCAGSVCARPSSGYLLTPSCACGVVSPQQPGEEISFCYIPLYQSRPSRQAELLDEKVFRCGCQRCAGSHEAGVAADATIDGFMCPKCPTTRKGYLLAPHKGSTPILKPVAKGKKAKGGKGGDRDESKAATASADPAGAAEEITRSPADAAATWFRATACSDVPDDYRQCTSCGKVFAMAPLRVHEVAVVRLFMTGQEHLARGSIGSARDALESALRDGKKLLHPHHAAMFHAHLLLSSVCTRDRDPAASVSHMREVVEAAEVVYPRWVWTRTVGVVHAYMSSCRWLQLRRFFLPKATLYKRYAESVQKLLNSARKFTPKVTRKYSDIAKAMMSQYIEQVRVCCG